MIIPTREGKFWKCSYCEAEYPTEDRARDCVASHNLILVPIAREDLGRLLQFLYIKEDKLITVPLARTIQKYAQRAARKE